MYIMSCVMSCHLLCEVSMKRKSNSSFIYYKSDGRDMKYSHTCNSGHLRDPENVSAIASCPLYRGFYKIILNDLKDVFKI